MPRKLLVDSRARYSGSPEFYNVRIFSHNKDVSHIRLVQAILPKSMYPVITGYNSGLSFSLGATADTRAIAQQNYDGNDLATELTTKFNADAGISGITVTYDADTNKLTLDNSSGGGDAFTIDGTIDEPVSRLLGLTPGTDFVVADTATTEFPLQVNLSFPLYLLLDVKIGGNQSEQVWTTANSHTFVVPYSDANFGDYQNFTQGNFYEQADLATDVNFIEMQIQFHAPEVAANGLWTFEGIDHMLLFEIEGSTNA